MKNVILGIMVASVSVAFAQTDGGSHILKNRIQAKEDLKVSREAELVAEQPHIPVASRTSDRSDFVRGVIRIKNGTPYIELLGTNSQRRMYPVNLHKSMATEGQELIFSYTVSEIPFVRGGQSDIAIRLYDVSIPARK